MADKNKAEKTSSKPASKKGAKKPYFSTLSGQLLLLFIVLASIVFLPTTVLLFIGMLPTVAALVVSAKAAPAKGLCVAATNFAGCYIFLLELWQSGNSFERSFNIMSDPMTIIIIYSAAALGYVLDWFFSSMFASVLKQRAKMRLDVIVRRQESLIEQWGRKVTGSIPLDEDGFPIKS